MTPAGSRTQAAVLAATILASSLAFIDGNIVTIAMPAIQEAFGAGFAAVQWVVNAYALMLGALILVAGGLGDRYGRRAVFLTGIGLFSAASVACAATPDVGTLIAARAVQGIGAALLVPQSLAIITATFPREIRGRAIGTWAAASAAATAIGPPLGGLLVDAVSWRAAFWINLPLAAVAIWLTLAAVPESRSPRGGGRLDWPGAALAIAGFGALAFGLTEIPARTGLAALAWPSIAAGLVLIAAFAWLERRVPYPIVPPDLFRSRTFTGANIVTVFLYGCLAATTFLVPFELVERRGLSTAAAAATMMPMAIIIAAGSQFTGALADRLGPRRFMVGGPAVVALGCTGFAFAHASFALGIVVPLLLLACGMAIVVSPLTTAVMNAAPEARSGAASGVNNAASRVAGLIAVALFGAVASLIYFAAAGEDFGPFGTLPDAADPARPALESAFLAAYRTAMALAAAWATLAALAAAVFIRADART